MKLYDYILPKRKEINAKCVKLWTVQWTSRHGKWGTDIEPMYKTFIDKKKAKDLKKALEDAHKLIGNTYKKETEVKLYKQDK
jgi:hypothetical protein